MKKLSDVWSFFSEGLGCLGSILITIIPFAVVALIANLLISRCDNRHVDPDLKAELQAYRDSISRLEQERQEIMEAVYQENLNQFYEDFNKYYPVFSSAEELEEWLTEANYSAFDLMFELYRQKYPQLDNAKDIDSLANYLFWAPPEYTTTCDTCGNEVTFSEY